MDFLQGRSQRVVLNGVKSQWSEVTSGVPQGSVLGPLLFVLYTNDIAEIIQCHFGIYADDTKIYSVIKSLCDTVNLQQDLDNIQDWSKLWLLNLNSEKCKFMHIGKSLCSSYEMVNADIPGEVMKLSEVTFEKDLGVWMTSNMDPSLHCQKAAASAMKVLGLIKRSFSRVSGDLFIFLYKTYVRPHLEYCVQLWCPYLARDIDVLERVQMRATKLVREVAKLSYELRLQKLGIYSLFCRRKRGDLIETYKILNGYYDIDCSKLFLMSTVHSTRGHSMKLFKRPSRLKMRLNFFTQRVVSTWNSLPEEVVSAVTVSDFKQKLDLYWGKLGYGYEQRPRA